MHAMNTKSHEADDHAEFLRLQRLLAMAGVGSRRHCEEFITTGRVTVDGKTVTELGARVNPEAQEVRLDGERIKVARKVYYILNKPTGVLCTNADPRGRPRVVDLFPRTSERLFTVGRLDENSQGLLLVTNDGDLAHRLAHPRFHVEKTYRVQVAGIPSREIVGQLQEGMYFSEGRFAAKDARLVKSKGHSALLEIVLTEGQNREIRRLLAKVGHKVQRLTRVGLGPLKLGELPSGEFRRLNADEVRALHDLVAGRSKPTGARSRSGPRSKPGGRPGSQRRPTRGGKRPTRSADNRPGSQNRDSSRRRRPRREDSARSTDRREERGQSGGRPTKGAGPAQKRTRRPGPSLPPMEE